jgi:hypothetical protein
MTMDNYTDVYSQGDEYSDDEESAEELEPLELAIKLNGEATEYECAVCGDARTSAEGPELFLADTWDLVCDECGRRHAPLLAALLDLAGAAEGYAAVMDSTQPDDGEAS